MTRTEYLAQLEVDSFVTWLAKNLNNPRLTHKYGTPAGPVKFDGIPDALAKYDWRFRFCDPNGVVHAGNTYDENAYALGILRNGIRNALEGQNDQDVRDWSIAIVNWGGVRNGNVKWLLENDHGLAQELGNVCAILAAGQDVTRDHLNQIRRFNAGMTKIYSLLLDDFIIYDSRVAAALTWLLTKWCVEQKRKEVPELLQFPCMRPKEGDNPAIRKLRNPSCGDYRFPWMPGGQPPRYAQWNLRANWILRETLNRCSKVTVFRYQDNSLRELEAALFMWGYNLQCSIPCADPAQRVQDDIGDDEPDADEELCSHSPAEQTAQDQSLHSSETRGPQGRRFQWEVDAEADCVRIHRSNGATDTFSIKEIFLILHSLYDQFGHDWFPLANNVGRLGNGTERPGLGTTILEGCPRNITHAQAASYLGVILEEIRLTAWNERNTGIAWRTVRVPPPTIEDLRDLLIGFL